MHTSPISPTSLTAFDAPRRRRAPQTRLVAAGPQQVTATQTLGARAAVVASASGPKWMFIAGGALLGGLIFSIPGALLGALGGYLLTR